MESKNFILRFSSCACAAVCVFSLVVKAPEFFIGNFSNMQIFSAGLIFSNGQVNSQSMPQNTLEEQKEVKEIVQTESTTIPTEQMPQTPMPEYIKDFVIPHGENEKTYKIIENKYTNKGIKYENFFVNNKTEYDINIGKELSTPLDFKIEKNNLPQVLILHTHTTESFMDKDQGFIYESFYPRTQNNNYNVTQVGNAIASELKKAGIGVVHDLTCHDQPSYNGSYKRSAETIDKNMSKYPSIKIILDIHRDSIGNNEKGHIKPTFTVNSTKAAQIMILSGYDKKGDLNFPDWEYNLRFALKLHKKAETLFPGLTRPMHFDEVKYNMHKSHGSLLIEVGSEVNTLQEAVLSGAMVGKALSAVLEENK